VIERLCRPLELDWSEDVRYLCAEETERAVGRFARAAQRLLSGDLVGAVGPRRRLGAIAEDEAEDACEPLAVKAHFFGLVERSAPERVDPPT